MNTIKHSIIAILFVFLVGFPKIISEISHKANSTQGFVTDSAVQSREQLCVENALYHEARGESPEGIRAVLEVIINRTKHKDFPSSFCKVILQDKQFSAFNHNPSKAFISPYKHSETEVKELIQQLAAKAVKTGLNQSDKVLDNPDVLYYHTHKVKPSWSKKMKLVKQVGKHKFFSNVKEQNNA